MPPSDLTDQGGVEGLVVGREERVRLVRAGEMLRMRSLGSLMKGSGDCGDTITQLLARSATDLSMAVDRAAACRR
jgi:hypothetical protein